jgi:hypothetical protein
MQPIIQPAFQRPPYPLITGSQPSPLISNSTASSQTFSNQGNTNPGKPFDVTMTPATPIRLGQPTLFNLQIRNPVTGRIPSHFDIVHEKPAHIIIVSQDLSNFQHVHPEKVLPGFLQVPATFKQPGPYKMFLQFTSPECGEQTLNKPFDMGRATRPFKPLMPDSTQPKLVDGYTYKISGLPTRQHAMGMPKVEVTKNGVPVTNIEPYLGAGAHGVIIGQNAQSFLHVHPMSKPQNGFYQSPIQFHTEIKQPGLYKMWVQTQIDGKVRTVDWTFQV